MPGPAGRVSGRRLRELRLKQGQPLEAIAVATLRSVVTCGRWERGETQPPTTVLPALAAALGVSVADIIEPDPAVALAERSCAEQGIEVRVSDPAVIERVAHLVGGASD